MRWHVEADATIPVSFEVEAETEDEAHEIASLKDVTALVVEKMNDLEYDVEIQNIIRMGE